MTAGERNEVRQYPARPYADRLTLIPPLADPEHDLTGVEPRHFSVYGNAEVNERVRKWALWHRYLLAADVSQCAHGLYMLSCPGNGCHAFGFDHTQIWVPDVAWGRPFILTQPYVSELPGRLREYAAAHGLELSVGGPSGDGKLSSAWEPPSDNWYSPGHALPIRLAIPASWPLWPIEEQAILLLHTQPVKWSEDDGT